MKIYKLTESLECYGENNPFAKGNFVYKESDFPVHYLILCDEDGSDIRDKSGDQIVYDWHPVSEKTCPWENKLEEYKDINED